ncbi:hypothetical protein MKW94_018152, partial [Papaver nudicaule]|nr:hypothetical protein [Papaver nudicaule]
ITVEVNPIMFRTEMPSLQLVISVLSSYRSNSSSETDYQQGFRTCLCFWRW